MKRESDLAVLIPKLRWAIPRLDPPRKIRVFLSESLKCPDIDRLDSPNYLGRWSKSRSPIQLVQRSAQFDDFRTSSLVIVWQAKAVMTPWVLATFDRVEMADPYFFWVREARGWQRVAWATASIDLIRELEAESKRNLERLQEMARSHDSINICGTGPSLDEIYDYNVVGGLNIVCNSIVRSERLLAHVRPKVMASLDAVFHMGPSTYAMKFRKDLVAAAIRHDAFVLVPMSGACLLASHHPELRGRLIGLHRHNPHPAELTIPVVVPSPDSLLVNEVGNVLTTFMFPLALAIGPRVLQIWGCDGRKPADNYFWKHNESVQYTDLMKAAFDAHPSFFRDQMYSDYYVRHCKTLEKMFRFAEKRGVEVRSCSTSYIPALANRTEKPKEQ